MAGSSKEGLDFSRRLIALVPPSRLNPKSLVRISSWSLQLDAPLVHLMVSLHRT